MKVIGIIPARMGSSRFPGKPLAKILGKNMIERVYTQCSMCPELTKIIVATDDERIRSHVKSFKGNVIMTSNKHKTGTERCAEALSKLKERYDVIVNIQGDQPYINPNQISDVIHLMKQKRSQIATLVKKIDNKLDRNVMKVFNVRNSVNLKTSYGGTSIKNIKKMIFKLKKELKL